jgi:hypothetical protein
VLTADVGKVMMLIVVSDIEGKPIQRTVI